jgi:hypothetical protein
MIVLAIAGVSKSHASRIAPESDELLDDDELEDDPFEDDPLEDDPHPPRAKTVARPAATKRNLEIYLIVRFSLT